MCQDWRLISVSKADKLSDETATEIVSNNKSREVWCSAQKPKA